MFQLEKLVVLLAVIVSAKSATYPERKSALPYNKRAVDNAYTYPLPILSFTPEKPKKVFVETIKSVGTNQRYLPPTGSGLKSGNPINVSISSYEASPASTPATGSTTAPTAAVVVNPTVKVNAPVIVSQQTQQQKKRPSGGLGAFKYYGGSGSSKTTNNNNGNLEAAVSETLSTIEAILPSVAPTQVKTATATATSTSATAGKVAAYEYPSPKNSRKPTKKEQKKLIADSKPEETSGYTYEVASPVAFAPAPAAPAPAMMGLSYMRQSSPFYSFHVMLD